MVDVGDLLATDGLRLLLLAGEATAPVRWVATSELEDPAPFLEGGELLLTTGLRPPADWTLWVRRLAAAGVTAVGFGVGLSHRTVPADLLTAAAGVGVAVVEVPGPTPFIAVSRRVADLLRRSENEAEAEAVRVQRELAADAAGPDGTSRVLRRLARSAGGDAWLLTPDSCVLAASGSTAPPAETADALARVRPQGVRAAYTDVTPGRTLLLRAVGSAPARWLLVRTAPDAPRALRGSVGTAAALLALLEDRSTVSDQRVDDLVRVALGLLWQGLPDAARDVLAVVGLDLPDPLVVVRTSGTVAAGTLGVDGHLVLAPASLPDVLDGLGDARTGVGRVAPAATAVTSRDSADQAFGRTSSGRPVVRAGESAAHGLAGVLGEESAVTYARDLLAPLDSLPVDEAEALRRTARAFLAHHGQRQPTADALGLHRNTVRNRIERLERVLGRSMDSADDRAELWLALNVPGGSPDVDAGAGPSR